MKAGKLRHRVTLQKNIGQKNEIGEVIAHWQDYATVAAEVKPLSGRAFFDAQQVNKEITVQIRIRYLAGVLSEHRLVFNSQVLEVVFAQNVEERNREWLLMCKELT